jgi:hypothetical protein
VLLVLDIEVIEHLLLLGLGQVGVRVLAVELALPHFDFAVLLLNQLDQVLVLVDKMRVLGQQQFNLFLQVIDFLTLPDLEQQLLVNRHQLRLQLPHSPSPIVLIGVGVGVLVAGRRVLIGAGA